MDPISAFFNDIIDLIVWVVNAIATFGILVIIASIFADVSKEPVDNGVPNTDKDFPYDFCKSTKAIEKSSYHIET